MSKIAIVGFGCAAYHAIKAIRDNGSTDPIEVFSDGALPPANPMLTTYYAAGKITYAQMFPFGSLEEIKSKYDIEIHTDAKVKKIDNEQKTIILEDGKTENFDKLLIATGAAAFKPRLKEGAKNRVYYMRTVFDAEKLKTALATQKIGSAVVVGGSMVGIKVIELLHNKGIKCTLIDMADRLFPMAALPDIASAIEARLTAKGLDLRLGCGLYDVVANDNGLTVKLADGSEMQCDMLAVCIGTRANTGIIKDTRIETGRGIIVDEHMETTVDDIFAAGDCCEGYNLQNGEHQIIGLWANAAYQGETAGYNMVGHEAEYYGNILHNITHFMDMDFISLGDICASGDIRTFGSQESGRLIQVLTDNGKVNCINILDDIKISGIMKNYILNALGENPAPVSPVMKGMLRRQGLSDELISLLGGNRNG